MKQKPLCGLWCGTLAFKKGKQRVIGRLLGSVVSYSTSLTYSRGLEDQRAESRARPTAVRGSGSGKGQPMSC